MLHATHQTAPQLSQASCEAIGFRSCEMSDLRSGANRHQSAGGIRAVPFLDCPKGPRMVKVEDRPCRGLDLVRAARRTQASGIQASWMGLTRQAQARRAARRDRALCPRVQKTSTATYLLSGDSALYSRLMRVVQITPGAGGMYCGNCFRDNGLVAAWRRLGHQAIMVPLYLPLTLEESDSSAGTPIFFSGINVYLDHKVAWFRRAPHWLRQSFTSSTLLHWIGWFAARTSPKEVADLTLSMLRGEHGNQARDLDELVGWLRAETKPDVVCLSNALLLGLAARLKHELDTPVVCFLAGEDSYLDAMSEPLRTEVWRTLAERTGEVDMFIAPSRYFADRMACRMSVEAGRICVVPPGISIDGYSPALPSRNPKPTTAPTVLGYFARMCPEKGLDTLVEAFIALKESGRSPALRLKVGGGLGPSDKSFVSGIERRLCVRGLLGDVEFHPNLDRTAKIAFLESLDVFSVPAGYGEAFGVYLLEALAAGVPVVQPRTAAFPEIVEATGGGLLCDAGDPESLAEAIGRLLSDPERRRRLGEKGRRVVREEYNIDAIARRHVEAIAAVCPRSR